jgi:hypothetical protein
MYNNIRERHYLTRRAIVAPRLSAWQHLLSYADEGSFLDVTGFNFASFRSLVTIVFDDELSDELQGRRKRGRPRSLDYSGRVGLVVFFLGSTLMTKHLCLIFGIVPSVANEEIHEMLERLVPKLKGNHHARVKFPDVNECRHLAELVRRREPLVPDVIGFTDGLKCTVQCGSDAAQQDLDYCGYGQDTFCNNIFLFGSDGKIKYGSVNNPGSWHDSPCSTTLRAKCIEKMIMLIIIMIIMIIMIMLIVIMSDDVRFTKPTGRPPYAFRVFDMINSILVIVLVVNDVLQLNSDLKFEF